MAKKITRQQRIGQHAEQLVGLRVVEMDWLWHPRGRLEAGVDGEIEIIVAATERPTNVILAVQVKGTERDRFTAETDDSFAWLCSQEDLDYWLGGNTPVILIVARPSRGEVYWKSIQEWFSSPERLASRRIVFDKNNDVFDGGAKEALQNLAVPRDRGLYLGPQPRRERLVTNLLAVKRLPPALFVASANENSGKAVGDKLRQALGYSPSEWVLRSGRILSPHDLSQPPWTEVCSDVEQLTTEEWAASNDAIVQAEFAEILYQCLAGRTHRVLKYRPRDHHLFFARPTRHLNPRRIRGKTGRRGRTIFQGYPASGGEVRFYRHAAFEAKFSCYGEQWYLAITPTFVFTRDGVDPYTYAAEYLTGQKQREHNNHVRSWVEMWVRYLQDPDNLLEDVYPYISFAGELESFDIDVGVDDGSWRGLPDHPEELSDGQESLFS
jgi:Domain of unknown function (DUF4365)